MVWVFGNQQQINKKAYRIFKSQQEMWRHDAKSTIRYLAIARKNEPSKIPSN
jgi:hypothetical protein